MGYPLFRGETSEEIFEANKNCNIPILENLCFYSTDLLYKMLDQSPSRITARACLQHPFFHEEKISSLKSPETFRACSNEFEPQQVEDLEQMLSRQLEFKNTF